MNGEPYGVHIERFIGCISVISCCAFIILTYQDWSRELSDCNRFYTELDRINSEFEKLTTNWASICNDDCRKCALISKDQFGKPLTARGEVCTEDDTDMIPECTNDEVLNEKCPKDSKDKCVICK